MAESQTEPSFFKFLQATIKTPSHELPDELLKRTPIKSMKSKMFQTRIKKVGTNSPRSMS